MDNQLKNVRIGDVLTQHGYITQEQLDRALEYQKTHRGQRIGQIILELGYVSERQLLTALAQHLNLQFIDLSTYPVNYDAVKRLPRSIASKYTAIAIGIKNGRLLVAVNDPLDFFSLEDIRIVANMDTEIAVAEKEKITRAISVSYADVEARSAAVMDGGTQTAAFSALAKPQDQKDADDSAPIVKLLNSLLVKGYVSTASDIHIEPFEDHTSVRMRIDGMLVDYLTLPASSHAAIITRLKILSGLDIAEKRLPQDGHVKDTISGYELDLRVSVIPTVHGEKAVIRYLSTAITLDNSDNFGMSKENADVMRRMLMAPHGIIYLTGPTGSGKTTTLYMAIQSLAKKPVNIITIEDPVEQALEKINQVQVNVEAGMTFEKGLRSILRQDPDIIMVGETRDAETASISVRAAITGHLVLSTLHTNDALSAVARLEDMGVEPFMLANALVGVVAQRLVRKLCPHCREAYEPDAAEQKYIGVKTDKLWRPVGCPACNNTGYKGRTAIHEMLVIDKKVRSMITHGMDLDEIMDYLQKEKGMKLLKDNMVDLALQGITSTEEILKVTAFVD